MRLGNGLEITEITILNGSSNIDPIASTVRIVLNSAFVINGIKIVKGKFGLFVSFPREYDTKKKQGMNFCFPITKKCHDLMTEKILTEYNLTQGAANEST